MGVTGSLRLLRSESVLFIFNPKGNRALQGQRYGSYMALETSKRILAATNFAFCITIIGMRLAL